MMKPLEPFRERLLVFSGLAQVQGRALGDGAGDHARAGATFLTGVHPKKSEINIRAGVSADQIAAQELSKHTQFASLELGIESNQLAGNCDSGYSCAYTNTISWRGETTPLPLRTIRARSSSGSSATARAQTPPRGWRCSNGSGASSIT